MKRAFGWREEDGVAGARSLRTTIGRPGFARGTKPSLRAHRVRRIYQGPYGACVAFAEVRAINVSHRAYGNAAAPMASPKHLYAIGRLQEYAGQPTELIPPLNMIGDVGMYPGLALNACRNLGFCSWNDDPYGTPIEKHSATGAAFADINELVRPIVARNAFDQAGLSWYEIPFPTGRMDAIEDCFAASMPVLFAMNVDAPFLEHRSSEPIKTISDETVGGHMMVGLEITREGHLLFDNWWDDWGFEDGFGVLHRDLVESFKFRNAVALRAAPVPGETK